MLFACFSFTLILLCAVYIHLQGRRMCERYRNIIFMKIVKICWDLISNESFIMTKFCKYQTVFLPEVLICVVIYKIDIFKRSTSYSFEWKKNIGIFSLNLLSFHLHLWTHNINFGAFCFTLILDSSYICFFPLHIQTHPSIQQAE